MDGPLADVGQRSVEHGQRARGTYQREVLPCLGHHGEGTERREQERKAVACRIRHDLSRTKNGATDDRRYGVDSAAAGAPSSDFVRGRTRDPGLYFWRESELKPHFLLPLTRPGGPPLLLRNERTGLPVATILEPAFESAARKRGLLGRDGLPPGHALIIAPTNLVHTFFMRFPIDVLFVTRDGTVVKASAGVPARRVAGAWRGFAVIEMAAGQLASSDTRAGDRLVLAGAAFRA